jgi:hypothetical protein
VWCPPASPSPYRNVFRFIRIWPTPRIRPGQAGDRRPRRPPRSRRGRPCHGATVGVRSPAPRALPAVGEEGRERAMRAGISAGRARSAGPGRRCDRAGVAVAPAAALTVVGSTDRPAPAMTFVPARSEHGRRTSICGRPEPPCPTASAEIWWVACSLPDDPSPALGRPMANGRPTLQRRSRRDMRELSGQARPLGAGMKR